MPVGKLRGRSAGELVTRARQALLARAERVGMIAVGEPDERALARLVTLHDGVGAAPLGERLLTSLRATGGERLFAGLADRTATTDAIRRLTPDAARTATARADAILARRFDLLGLRDLSFGDPIDWSLEPVSGRRAPNVHWSRVPYLDAAVVGDHKVVWELNRHGFLYTLGRAYWLTGDERYAARAVELIEQWMAANPPKTGINWSSSLEVAFRSIAWVWALHFFRESAALRPDVVRRMYAFLHVHGTHLEQHLSTYFSPNTHLTGEALGLLYLGVGLPELRAAAHWKRLGWRILEHEVARHVTADGVYFERASYYHRYTVDFYVHALLLVGRDRPASDDRVARALRGLLSHLQQIARDDGSFALVGDDDGGRLAPLDDAALDDCRPPLGTGAALLGEPTLAWMAGGVGEESVWLLGPARAHEWAAVTVRPPEELSVAYRDGGYCVLRDGWRGGANRLLLDCGPHGALSYGHSHDDALAIDVVVDGTVLLADPGTFSYVDAEARDYFRGARSHSTVLVAGEEGPSQPAGAFRWETASHAELRRWIVGSHLELAEASRPAADGAPASVQSVRRGVVHVPGAYWALVDRPQSANAVSIETHFHAAPGVSLDREAGRVVLRGATGAALRIASVAAKAKVTVSEGWTSRAYASRTRCVHVTATASASTGRPAVTLLFPTSAIDARIERIEVSAGVGVAIATSQWRDSLVVGSGVTMAAAGIDTDAHYCWLRRDAETGELLAWAAVEATRLTIDGKTLFDGAERRELMESGATRPRLGLVSLPAEGGRERTRTATRN